MQAWAEHRRVVGVLVRHELHDDTLRSAQYVELLGQEFLQLLVAERLAHGLFDELALEQEAVAVQPGAVQGVQQGRLEALRAALGQAQPEGDPVGEPEPHPVHLGEAVRVLLDDLQDVRHLLRLPALDAEVVGDAGCVGGGHPGALQQHHQLADLLVLLPGGEDLRAPRRPDQVHLQQSLRRGVDDVEGVLLELVDDSLGEPWPDALHQARREVPADRVTGGGLDVLAALGGELVPVGGVVATLPDQPQRLAGLDTQQHRALRGDALPILQAQADHGEAGAVDEHDPLDDPLHAFPRHGYAHTHTPCS